MAPLYVQDFADLAAAIDERVLAGRGKRSSLDVRIHRGDGAAEPKVILEAIREHFTAPDGGPLVPYAMITDLGEDVAGDDPAKPLISQLRERTPGGWGRLRFPQYEMFRSILDGERHKNTARNRAFRRLYPNITKAEEEARRPGEEMPWWAGLARLLLMPVLGSAVRWWFGRRWRRRMRVWLPRIDGTTGEDVFDAAERLARDKPRLVLLCALFADLDSAFTPLLSPWRRRRRSGFVLLLDRPSLELLDEALRACPARHVTVVSAPGAPVSEALTLAQAANSIRHRRSQVHLSTSGVPEGATAGDLAEGHRSPAKTGRNGFAVLETLCWISAVVVVLAGGGWYLRGAPAPDRSCIGTDAPGTSVTTQSVPSPENARRRYDADKNAIVRNNQKADAKEQQGYTVKTIVYIGSGVTGPTLEEPEFNGVLPELSGIRLAQERVNELADAEPRSANNLNGNVYIRVDVREAGTSFKNAPAIARQVTRKPKSTVLGVIGLGESHKETIEAQRILADGGMPMLGMGATSENLQSNDLYRQVAWDNRREARLAADFLRNANIVEDRTSAACTTANHAIVIGDGSDDYSLTLARDVVRAYPPHELFWDRTAGQAGGTVVKSLTELAGAVCNRLHAQPRTVIYWAGRAPRLRDFLKEAKSVPSCPSTFTVVADDDVTTTATGAEGFGQQFSGVTLFHAALALTSAPPNNRAGNDFMTRYHNRYGTDAWYEDWRGPIAYDGLLTMAQAVNAACQQNQQAGCGRGSTQSQLADGVGGRNGVLGATGTISFVDDLSKPAGKVPIDKRFLMMRDDGIRRTIVMDCGRRADKDVRTRWGPGGKFPCVH